QRRQGVEERLSPRREAGLQLAAQLGTGAPEQRPGVASAGQVRPHPPRPFETASVAPVSTSALPFSLTGCLTRRNRQVRRNPRQIAPPQRGPMRSLPPHGRSTSGTTTEPSACW